MAGGDPERCCELGWVRKRADAAPGDVPVWADEHDAAPFDSIEVMPSSGVDEVADKGNPGGSRNVDSGIESSFARRR